jgi:Tfp pilus assembly protein PilO
MDKANLLQLLVFLAICVIVLVLGWFVVWVMSQDNRDDD